MNQKESVEVQFQ